MKPTPEKWPATARAQCLRLLTAHLGKNGVRLFLKQRQPGLGFVTGAELLQDNPEELLRQLRQLDANQTPESNDL